MKKYEVGRRMAILMALTLALGLVRPIQGLINYKVNINKLDAYEVVPKNRASNIYVVNNCEKLYLESPNRYLCRNTEGQDNNTMNDYYVTKTGKSTNSKVNTLADRSIEGYDKDFNTTYYLKLPISFSKEKTSNERHGVYKDGQGQILPNKYTELSWSAIQGTGLDYFFIGSRPFFKSERTDVYNYTGDKLFTAKNAYFLREYNIKTNIQDKQGIVYSNGKRDYNVYGTDIHSKYPILNVSYHDGKTYGVVEKDKDTLMLVEFQNRKTIELMQMNYSHFPSKDVSIKIDFDHQIVILSQHEDPNYIDLIYSMKSHEPIVEKVLPLLDSPELDIFKNVEDEYVFIQNGELVSTLDYNDFKDKLFKMEDKEYLRINDTVIVFKDEQFEKVIVNNDSQFERAVGYSFNKEDIESYTKYNGIDYSENNIQFVVDGQRQPEVYDQAFTGRYNDKTVYLVRKGDELQLLDDEGKVITRATLRTKMKKFGRFAVYEHENGLAISEDIPRRSLNNSKVGLVMVDGNAFATFCANRGGGGVRYVLGYGEDKHYSIIRIDKNYNELGEPIKLKAEIDQNKSYIIDFDSLSGTLALTSGYKETEYTYLFDESGNLIAQGDEVENYKVKRFEYSSDETKVTLFNLAGEEVITLNSEDFNEREKGDYSILKLNGKEYVVRPHKYTKEPRN